MPGTDGLTATRAIAADPSTAATKVVMLTTYDLDEYLFEALQAGAAGFLLKGISPEDLIARHPGGRGRRMPPRPVRHPAAHRRVRRRPPDRPAGRCQPGAGSSASRPGSSKSWP